MSKEKNQLLSVLNYNGATVAFEEIDGKMMVNATQMAKPFGKQPIDWLKHQQAKDLVETISKVRKISLAEIQHVRRGGNNPGTFFNEDLALLFAQWLSPEFYLACNTKLKELLTQRALELPSKHGVSPVVNNGRLWYAYVSVMRAIGGSTRSSASKRREKHPEHFLKLFGRNFISGEYFDLLKGYYDYRNASNQLSMAL